MKKLTKQQQRMLTRLEAGERMRLINTHHMSGGTLVWCHDETPAGYKVFFNLMRSLGLEREEYYSEADKTFGTK